MASVGEVPTCGPTGPQGNLSLLRLAPPPTQIFTSYSLKVFFFLFPAMAALVAADMDDGGGEEDKDDGGDEHYTQGNGRQQPSFHRATLRWCTCLGRR